MRDLSTSYYTWCSYSSKPLTQCISSPWYWHYSERHAEMIGTKNVAFCLICWNLNLYNSYTWSTCIKQRIRGTGQTNSMLNFFSDHREPRSVQEVKGYSVIDYKTDEPIKFLLLHSILICWIGLVFIGVFHKLSTTQGCQHCQFCFNGCHSKFTRSMKFTVLKCNDYSLIDFLCHIY